MGCRIGSHGRLSFRPDGEPARPAAALAVCVRAAHDSCSLPAVEPAHLAGRHVADRMDYRGDPALRDRDHRLVCPALRFRRGTEHGASRAHPRLRLSSVRVVCRVLDLCRRLASVDGERGSARYGHDHFHIGGRRGRRADPGRYGQGPRAAGSCGPGRAQSAEGVEGRDRQPLCPAAYPRLPDREHRHREPGDSRALLHAVHHARRKRLLAVAAFPLRADHSDHSRCRLAVAPVRQETCVVRCHAVQRRGVCGEVFRGPRGAGLSARRDHGDGNRHRHRHRGGPLRSGRRGGLRRVRDGRAQGRLVLRHLELRPQRQRPAWWPC